MLQGEVCQINWWCEWTICHQESITPL
jgi:hypothetical protein